MRSPRFGPGGPFNEGPSGDGQGDDGRGGPGTRGPRGHRGHEGRGPGGRGGGWGGPPPHGGFRGRHEGDGPPGFRGRTRRGEIRTGLLAILLEGPGHGYELIQRIEEKTGGAWKPSPGSVYPTLQLLQDEGFVTVEERDGKRIFSLTDEGRAETERRTAEAGETPWTRDGRGKPAVVAMFESVKLLHMAAHQIVKAGSADQVTAATEALNEARKKLYQLLAAE